MTVSTSGGIPTVADPALYKSVGKKDLDRNDFMKLFVTQLQYQDPTKPMDTYEMSSQLAQFSSMDATLKMKESMDQLLDFQTSQNNLSLMGLLGRTVEARGNQVSVDAGTVNPTSFELAGACDTCVVEIMDSGGHVVRKLDLGNLDPGRRQLAWDGNNDGGAPVADGSYSYTVRATDSRGQAVSYNAYTSGKVTGIAFAGGSTVLTVDHSASVGADKVVTVQ